MHGCMPKQANKQTEKKRKECTRQKYLMHKVPGGRNLGMSEAKPESGAGAERGWEEKSKAGRGKARLGGEELQARHARGAGQDPKGPRRPG